MIYMRRSDNSVESVIQNNETLRIGTNFLTMIRSLGIVSSQDSISPAIVGGAVRNGLFSNTTINDIDIFFYSNRSNTHLYANNESSVLQDLRENLLVWLEDEGIEFQSLLRDPSELSSYAGANHTFMDIIQFEWQGATIQVMIPTSSGLSTSLSDLIYNIPVVCQAVINLECLVCSNSFVASQYMPEGVYPVTSDIDVAYLRKKHPGCRVIRFDGPGTLIYYALSSFMTRQVISLETRSFSSLSPSTSAQILKSAVAEKLRSVDEDSICFGPLPPSF